jgi:N-acyl-D-amino-acid deacylase
MKRWTLFICMLLFAAPVVADTIVLVNGTVVDGTGKPRVAGNVRIRDGRIVDIGVFKPAVGETTIEIKGMIVASGFVDLQGHPPSAIQNSAAMEASIMSGVTTVVLGSDGTGVYSVEDFMLPFDERPPILNIAMLVGHATIRRQIMGPDYKRAANADEIRKMSELVLDAMKQGAFGFASDLQQEPASFSTPEELMALAKVAGQLGGTVVMKLRNENDKALDSIKEAIALAREGKIAVQVFTTNKIALAEIEKAHLQRVDIAADSYSFAQFARDKGVTVERAVQRMSAVPASRISLRERGSLKKGAAADIVVFNPQALSSGMKYVFVNGTMVVQDGKLTDARPGHALR